MADKEKETIDNTPTQKTETELVDAFIAEYNALCEEHGYRIVANPSFRARDDGTFSIVIPLNVGKAKNK